MRETGTIRWYNQTREFGFIGRDGAEDLYLNPRSLRDVRACLNLWDGIRVEFTVVENRGRLYAADVVVLG